MKKLVLFTVFAVSGCVSVNRNRLDHLEFRVDGLRKELNQTQYYQDAEKIEKLAKLEKENDRFERILGFLHQLALGDKWHLTLIKQLQFENITRFAETAQVRKDLADVCALLRKYYKIRKDHVCFSETIKKLQSNPKTENEIILEEFNKKVKQIERRRKKK